MIVVTRTFSSSSKSWKTEMKVKENSQFTKFTEIKVFSLMVADVTLLNAFIKYFFLLIYPFE